VGTAALSGVSEAVGSGTIREGISEGVKTGSGVDVKVSAGDKVATADGIINVGGNSRTMVNVGDAMAVGTAVGEVIDGFAPQAVIIAAPVMIRINNSVRFIYMPARRFWLRAAVD
jgi:hypothetical protein